MTLDRIEALLGEATPGPWQAWPHDHSTWDGRRNAVVGHPANANEEDAHGLFAEVGVHGDTANADARAIVVSRNVLPVALAVIRAATKAELHLQTMERQALNPGPDHLVAVTVETWREAVSPTIRELYRALRAFYAVVEENLP